MSSNYEWNRHLTEERLQNRFQEAAEHRRAKLGKPGAKRPLRFWINLFSWFAALWRRKPQRQSQSGKEKDDILGVASSEHV